MAQTARVIINEGGYDVNFRVPQKSIPKIIEYITSDAVQRPVEKSPVPNKRTGKLDADKVKNK